MFRTKSYRKTNLLAVFLAALTGLLPVNAQIATGGVYKLDQAVVANGGGTTSQVSIYKVEGTAGQSAAGTTSNGGVYSARGGFWTQQFVPTAALVQVGGRVTTANGNGLRNAYLTLIEANGARWNAITGPFGYYRFDDIAVGQTVIITISSKRFTFTEPARVLNVMDALDNVDFIAN
jgi:hypothetical protein